MQVASKPSGLKRLLCPSFCVAGTQASHGGPGPVRPGCLSKPHPCSPCCTGHSTGLHNDLASGSPRMSQSRQEMRKTDLGGGFPRALPRPFGGLYTPRPHEGRGPTWCGHLDAAKLKHEVSVASPRCKSHLFFCPSVLYQSLLSRAHSHSIFQNFKIILRSRKMKGEMNRT